MEPAATPGSGTDECSQFFTRSQSSGTVGSASMSTSIPKTKSEPGAGDALPVDHPRVRSVDRDIFRLAFVTDCFEHQCLCRDDGNRARADACCQHGSDVLLPEKAAILRRATEVASVLKPKWRDPETWFDEREPGT